jgi:hypothetical protein
MTKKRISDGRKTLLKQANITSDETSLPTPNQVCGADKAMTDSGTTLESGASESNGLFRPRLWLVSK